MKIIKTHFLLLALVFLVGLNLSISKAEMNREVSIERLTEMAEVIVLGRCLTSYSDWNEQKTEIYTYTLIEALQLLKGKGESPLIVETLGGRVGDLVSNVIGAPSFTEGQKVLLFLFRKQNGQLGIIGLNKVSPMSVITQEDGRARFRFRFGLLSKDGEIVFTADGLNATIVQE